MNKNLAFAIIFLSIILSACTPQADPTSAPAAAQPAGSFVVEGSVVPAEYIELAFGAPGQVAEILVKDGERVAAGQPLARLASSMEAQAALALTSQNALLARQALEAIEANAALALAESRVALLAAQDQVDEAQNNLDNSDSAENDALLAVAQAKLALAEKTFNGLETSAGIDPDVLEAAQARLSAAEAAAASAQAAIDAAELKSTLAGVVTDLTLKAGQRVAVGQAVLTVAETSQWLVKTDNLTETDVALIQPGQKVSVSLDALPGAVLNGVVQSVNLRAEEKRGDITYTITIALVDPQPEIRWGMTAAVQFIP